jgi:hypothetical protein
MSRDATSVALEAILDAFTMVQEQLDALKEGGQRIEAMHKHLLSRLDVIDAGQAAVADLTPILETLLERSIEDRTRIQDQLGTLAIGIGFAHSSANGNRAPLPESVAGDPLLERFILVQPADIVSNERALVHWRAASTAAGTAELVAILENQEQPSPTDTPETRVLRYRLAAITRATIKGRGAALPGPPTTTIARDRSAVACMIRSQELAQLWRAGESAALYAEPELAGAIDLFGQAEGDLRLANAVRSSPELTALHRELAALVEAGHRPSLTEGFLPCTDERANANTLDKER